MLMLFMDPVGDRDLVSIFDTFGPLRLSHLLKHSKQPINSEATF